MANDILSTGANLLSEGGTGDGKVKCNNTDTAGYLSDKLYSSNGSISITYIPNEKKISITENNSYEKVISPATNFPIMSSNATFNIPTYVAGQAAVNGYVNKINLPSGQIGSISLFGGQNSSNNKHLSVAIYGSNTDDVQSSTKIGEALDVTSSSYIFTLVNPINITEYKFYWVMWVLTAESNGGDAVNAMTTNITGAGVGEWPRTAGIGYINNPFSGTLHFEDSFNYTINYTEQTAFAYIQLNIDK